MSDLLERDRKEGAAKTLPKVRPPRPPIPRYEKPKPTRLFRWIEWMALIVVVVATAVLVGWLVNRGGDDTIVVPEHGEFTPAYVRDTSGHDYSGYVAGNSPNLDPDVVLLPGTGHPSGYVEPDQGPAGVPLPASPAHPSGFVAGTGHPSG